MNELHSPHQQMAGITEDSYTDQRNNRSRRRRREDDDTFTPSTRRNDKSQIPHHLDVIEVPYIVFNEMHNRSHDHLLTRLAIRDWVNSRINRNKQQRGVLIEFVELPSVLPNLYEVTPANRAIEAEYKAAHRTETVKWMNDLDLYRDISDTKIGYSPGRTFDSDYWNDNMLHNNPIELKVMAQVCTQPLVVFILLSEEDGASNDFSLNRHIPWVFPFAKIVFLRSFLSDHSAPFYHLSAQETQQRLIASSIERRIIPRRRENIPVEPVRRREYLHDVLANNRLWLSPMDVTSTAMSMTNISPALQAWAKGVIENEGDGLLLSIAENDFHAQHGLDDMMVYPYITRDQEGRHIELGARAITFKTVDQNVVECKENERAIDELIAFFDEYAGTGDRVKRNEIRDGVKMNLGEKEVPIPDDLVDLIHGFSGLAYENDI